MSLRLTWMTVLATLFCAALADCAPLRTWSGSKASPSGAAVPRGPAVDRGQSDNLERLFGEATPAKSPRPVPKPSLFSSLRGDTSKKGAAKQAEIDSELALADLDERHGQSDGARARYRKIIQAYPTHPAAYHRLGVIAAKEESFADSNQFLQKAVELGPPSVELLNDLGYNYYLQDRYEEAEQVLRHALKQKPKHEECNNNLGLVLGAQGRFAESLETFRRVNTEAEAHAHLAFVISQQEDLDNATQEDLKALTEVNMLRSAAVAGIHVDERQKRLDQLATHARQMASQPPIDPQANRLPPAVEQAAPPQVEAPAPAMVRSESPKPEVLQPATQVLGQPSAMLPTVTTPAPTPAKTEVVESPKPASVDEDVIMLPMPKIKAAEPRKNSLVAAAKPGLQVEKPRPTEASIQPQHSPRNNPTPAVLAPTIARSKPAVEIAPPKPIQPTLVPPIAVEDPKAETSAAPSIVIQEQLVAPRTPARNAAKPAVIVRHPLLGAAIAKPEKAIEQKSSAAEKIAAAPIEKPDVKHEVVSAPAIKAEPAPPATLTISDSPLPTTTKPAKRSLVSKSTWGAGESAVAPRLESVANTPSTIPADPVVTAVVEREATKPQKPTHITREPLMPRPPVAEAQPRVPTRTAPERSVPSATAKIAETPPTKPAAKEELDVLPPPTVRSSAAPKHELASAKPAASKEMEAAESPRNGNWRKVTERKSESQTPTRPKVEINAATSSIAAPATEQAAFDRSLKESTKAASSPPATQSSVGMNEFRPPANSALGGFVSTNPRTPTTSKDSAVSTPPAKPREAGGGGWTMAQRPAPTVPQSHVPADRSMIHASTIGAGNRAGNVEAATARVSNTGKLPPIVSSSEYSAGRPNPTPAANARPSPAKSEFGEPARFGGWIKTGATR